ncbi:Hint domain-containing protein [Palleronia sp.]|uniref:Hint domain-containing protein n=1 Tax=Palleronia sp. TaxID=1940284 RepID=UPI0035C87861
MTFWSYDWGTKCYYYSRPDGSKVISKPLDGIVEGTSSADTIDGRYADHDGDRIDNNDAILGDPKSNRDIVDAFDGNDTIYAGAADDTVYGGAGDESIDGGTGDDVLYGDSTSGLSKVSCDPRSGATYTVAAWDLSDINVTLNRCADDPFEDDTNGEPTGDVAGTTFTISAGAAPQAVGISDDDGYFNDGDPNQVLTERTTLDGNTEHAGDRFTPEYSYLVESSSGEQITIYVGEFDGNDAVAVLSDKPLMAGETYTFVARVDTYPQVAYTDLVDTYIGAPEIGAMGEDTIHGGDGNDAIYGEGGDDVLKGGAGNDSIDGGAGNDSIWAGSGQDTVEGGKGDDFISGGAGADTLRGGDGNDEINAHQDGDDIDGGAGNDFLRGNIGDDTIRGGDGDDTIVGGLSADEIYGDGGNDSINAAGGDDTVDGGAGNDTINGGDEPGDDLLKGGDDRDTFELLTGNDTVLGGSGGDDFDTLDLRGSVSEGGAYKIIDVRPDDDTGDTVDGDSDNDGIDGRLVFYDADGKQNGTITFENIENIVPCFTPGTLIATPRGEVPVEKLREGDRVITRDNGIQEIRWIGEKRLRHGELERQPELRPVLVRKGALGYGLPERDMLISPNHRMLSATDETALYFEEREVLVAAKHLCHAEGIEQVGALGVCYIHFMFDRHEVVLSDGTWSESFQPGDYTLQGIDGPQRQEILTLFPELADHRGIEGYRSARRSLKRHEAGLLFR